MVRSVRAAPKRSNLTVRLDPLARVALQELAIRERSTQTAVLERLIMAAVQNPDGYYLRSAAINAFTAAALARVVLGVVAGDRPQLMAALGVVDGVSRGLFGDLPPPPSDALGFDGADPRVELLLGAYGLFDPSE